MLKLKITASSQCVLFQTGPCNIIDKYLLEEARFRMCVNNGCLFLGLTYMEEEECSGLPDISFHKLYRHLATQF